MTAYADTLDYAGRAQRQRKVRTIRQDSREPDELTATILRGMGYTIDKSGMKFGDYGWDIRPESHLGKRGYASAVVERKTLADLRDTARLVKQLRTARLVMANEHPDRMTFFVVLIEYLFDTDRKRRWSDVGVRGAKMSLQAGGVKVIECDPNDVARAIDDLYKWSQKLRHELAGGFNADAE